MQFEEAFRVKKPIIGMLHLRGKGNEQTFEIAKTEIQQMYDSGIDAILVENYYGDLVDVVNALRFLQENYSNHVYGVNVLGNFELSYELVKRYGGAFMQVDSIRGHLRTQQDKEYAEMIERVRDGSVFVLGGVRFKYQPVRSGKPLDYDLKIGMQRCDAIVVTGEGTRMNTDMEKIREFRRIIGDFPLIVGAGMTIDTCEEQLAIADGAIVGSWFKERGFTRRPVSPERMTAFMQKVKELRETFE